MECPYKFLEKSVFIRKTHFWWISLNYVGKTAKLGIWFLMITFGAAFGYTVMGRIALLAIRIEFLLNDWLWIIDPSQSRILM